MCKCGYDFANEMLAVIRDASQSSDSYAVIREDHYRRFKKLEVKAWTAESKKKRFKAIRKAAQYISRMYVCPECARLVVNFPESDEIAFYAREE